MTIQIEFTEEEVKEILEDYYGEIEEFQLKTVSIEEIKTAIVNR